MGGDAVAKTILMSVLLLGASFALGASSLVAEDNLPEIKMASGRFEPAELRIPANTPVKLRVTNADQAAIEFESFELHRERVVQPGETITVYLPALAPGHYPIFDDFHRGSTAEAAIVAE
jgi:heme/copper-type cytochrome/quinol oxidase subunit 2